MADERTQTIDLYAGGEINREEFARRCRRHDADLVQSKSARLEIMKLLPALQGTNLINSSIRRFCESVRNGSEASEDDNLRKLVVEHLEKITYDRGRVILFGSIRIRAAASGAKDLTSDAARVRFKVERQIQLK